MPLFPKNDELIAFCNTNGYPSQYNDCLRAYLRDIFALPEASLPDLMKLWDGSLTSVTPTKEFTFTGGSLPVDFTFTRSSVGRYFNSSGTLTTAAINTPRFDYNPSTLAISGLLIEESQTNSCLQSETIGDSTWVKNRITVSDNAVVAPDGATTADTVVENTATGLHQFLQSGIFTSIAAGTDITTSCFAKQGSGTRYLQFVTSGSAIGATNIAAFDLQTGAALKDDKAESVSVSIDALPNGWYKCSFTITTTNLGDYQQVFRFSTTLSDTSAPYTGDGSSSITVWGVQVELGVNGTSYIPTTTIPVTRGADVATISGTSFSDWYNATEGTFVVSSLHSMDNSGTYISINNSTTNESIDLGRSADTQSTMSITDGGVTQFTSTLTASGDNSISNSSLAYKLNDCIAATNGVLGTLDTSATLPTVNRLIVNSVIPHNFHIRNIKYFDTRLSDGVVRVQSQL